MKHEVCRGASRREDEANLLLQWSTFLAVLFCYSHHMPLHFSAHFHSIHLRFPYQQKPRAQRLHPSQSPLAKEGCPERSLWQFESTWLFGLNTSGFTPFIWSKIACSCCIFHMQQFTCFLAWCQPVGMECEEHIMYKEDDHTSAGTSQKTNKIGRNPS